MFKRNIVRLLLTHLIAIGIGFVVGVYTLPILIAPPAPDAKLVEQAEKKSEYIGRFSRDREGSDVLHWGEGLFSVSPDAVTFGGTLAPGPDYQLYLSPVFVETEADFKQLKEKMKLVGSVKTFENFVVPMPTGVDLSSYNTVVVWCESFGRYISSGTYQRK